MRIVTDPPRHQEGGMLAQVSFASTSGFGVLGASRLTTPLVFAPRGISYMPSVGDHLLMLPIEGRDVCVGALTSPIGIPPGEVRISSAGGAVIRLAANGEIHLNGAVVTRDGRVLSR